MSDAAFNINSEDIAAVMRKRLEGYRPELLSAQVGRVVEVGDGIARVSGLPGVSVKVNVDPSILGGIVATIGDTVIDGSIRRRLDQLKESL